MRLQIDPHWAVDWDGSNLTLVHLTVITGEGKGARMTKAENIGKMRETNEGYYGKNLRAALQGYVERVTLAGEGTVDLTGLITKLQEIHATLKAFSERYAGAIEPLIVGAVPKAPRPVGSKPVAPAEAVALHIPVEPAKSTPTNVLDL